MAGQGRDTRETKVGEHTVRISGRTDPPRAFRGFFVGDDLPKHHAPDPGSVGEQEEKQPDDHVVIEIDGAPFELHRLTSGWFHLHALPFQRFATVDDAVEELVRLIDEGVLRGGA